MKLETIETTTLYLVLPSSHLPAIRDKSWQGLPALPGGVKLYSAPDLDRHVSAFVTPRASLSHGDRSNLLLRIQVRADFLAGLDLHTTGNGMELRLMPDQVCDLNHNIVGPLSLEGVLEARDAQECETPASGSAFPDRVAVVC